MKYIKAKEKYLAELYKSILELRDVEEVEKYLKKMLSQQELNDIARKIEIIELLDCGKTYREIQNELMVSPITIRNARLGKGAEKKVVKGVQDETSKKKRNEKIKYPKSKQALYYKGWRV